MRKIIKEESVDSVLPLIKSATDFGITIRDINSKVIMASEREVFAYDDELSDNELISLTDIYNNQSVYIFIKDIVAVSTKRGKTINFNMGTHTIIIDL